MSCIFRFPDASASFACLSFADTLQPL